MVKGNAVKIRQKGNDLIISSHPEGADEDLFSRYFRLDDDLPRILSVIDRDPAIHMAIQRFYGLRLIRQEPWECLISFMCATRTSVPAIRKMVEGLSRMYGRRMMHEGIEFFSFPEAEELAGAPVDALTRLVAYRAGYIREAARLVSDGELRLNDLISQGYEEARKKLMEIRGVGRKVADCVSLFSLEKMESFPVDVWVKRAVHQLYSDRIAGLRQGTGLTGKQYERIASFAREYFDGYAGYAQEYLYHHWRTVNIRKAGISQSAY